jgi:hypothetical protein
MSIVRECPGDIVGIRSFSGFSWKWRWLGCVRRELAEELLSIPLIGSSLLVTKFMFSELEEQMEDLRGDG